MVKVLNKTITQNTYYISRIICLHCQKHQDVKSTVCHRPPAQRSAPRGRLYSQEMADLW